MHFGFHFWRIFSTWAAEYKLVEIVVSMADTEEYKPTTDENTSQNAKQESEDTVRTLFITGFPADVLEREVHNLFRFRYPLYDGCIIKASSRRKEPVVFAVFRTREEAEEAMKDFDGIVFDPALGSKLKIEFAKSNTRVKRDWAHTSSSSSFDENRRSTFHSCLVEI